VLIKTKGCGLFQHGYEMQLKNVIELAYGWCDVSLGFKENYIELIRMADSELATWKRTVA
jgi:hypothetical protein